MHLLLFAALIISIAPVHSPEPNRQPQMASTADLTALVFGSGNSIWISFSHDNGRKFSTATRVADVPALALGRHRGPRVTISGRTVVVSAVCGDVAPAGTHSHGGLSAGGDLVAWRSTDEGKSWSKPVVINDVPGSAREGLFAIAAGGSDEIASVWLDLRSSGTRLYGAFSKDSGATWSKNVLVYESPEGTICQCCHPSLVSSGGHKFQVMFRNVIQGERDMYLATWDPNGSISKPEKLGLGSWDINACPMDGGGIARRGAAVVTAWRRDRTIYLEAPGRPETPVGEGRDVALALSGRGPCVAWSGAPGVEVHCTGDKGPSQLSSSGTFPMLTTLANGSVLAAWEQNGGIQTEVISSHR